MGRDRFLCFVCRELDLSLPPEPAPALAEHVGPELLRALELASHEGEPLRSVEELCASKLPAPMPIGIDVTLCAEQLERQLEIETRETVAPPRANR